MVVELADDCIARVGEVYGAAIGDGDRIGADGEPLVVVADEIEGVFSWGDGHAELPAIGVGEGEVCRGAIDLDGEYIDPGVTGEFDGAGCDGEICAAIGGDRERDAGGELA